MTRLMLTVFAVSAASVAIPALAQITVQQPVIDVSSVATTVSVPDRGRAFLGGVSSAGSSRAQYGPFRNGSSVGMFRNASSMSVTAYIHDFDEMDRALLSQAGPTTPTTVSVDPYRSLLARSQRRGTSLATPAGEFSGVRSTGVGRYEAGSSFGAGASAAVLPEPPKMAADQAARSFELARQAASRGASGVARLHYKMAIRHGHPDAEARLAELDSLPVKQVLRAPAARTALTQAAER